MPRRCASRVAHPVYLFFPAREAIFAFGAKREIMAEATHQIRSFGTGNFSHRRRGSRTVRDPVLQGKRMSWQEALQVLRLRPLGPVNHRRSETMSTREFFCRRWEAEVPAMLRVIRAVPADKPDYRPHPVSRSAGELLALLGHEVEGAIAWTRNPDLDWEEPKVSRPPEEVAAAFQHQSQALVESVRAMEESYWNGPARLRVGGQVVYETTMEEMLWGLLLDAVHHRGQLSVYLRPMGAKVPSIYGPSADDPGA